MKERVRFGRYIRFALSFGDYAVLNLVFLSICFLVGKDAPFVSKSGLSRTLLLSRPWLSFPGYTTTVSFMPIGW